MNIIAINGYAKSGKDTVGAISQWLLCPNTGGLKLEDVLDKNYKDHQWWLEDQSGWEIKKFAGKLKAIASLLTGISVEKFEDQEFKKTSLGREWWTDQGIYTTISEMEEKIGHKSMTVREFLQKLGTEAIREGVHTNAWVNALFADYQLTKKREQGIKIEAGCWKWRDVIIDSSFVEFTDYPKWIITDCRFENEAQAVKDRGGIVVRVNRKVEGTVQRADGLWIKPEGHPSEVSLDNWNFDHVIHNIADIEYLIDETKSLMTKFFIPEFHI